MRTGDGTIASNHTGVWPLNVPCDSCVGGAVITGVMRFAVVGLNLDRCRALRFGSTRLTLHHGVHHGGTTRVSCNR